MQKKPTYEELEQRVRESEKKAVRRKKAEEALRKKEKRLKSLLAELAAKNEELDFFVYRVSHDLKSPIVTIDGFVGALREDFGDVLSEDGEKYLGYISDAAQKMELLINDLLALSRIGRVTRKKTEFPFARLVKNALRALQPQIKARGIVVILYTVTNCAFLKTSFRRKPESSDLDIFWMPDQVRHDGLGTL